MARTQVTGKQVGDGSIQRDDLDAVTAGQAVIKKIISGTGITLSFTGADSGTGDVTINATGGGGGASALSALVAATVANTINNINYGQTWNWQLATNTTGFAIGENAASTGGTGTQYLHTIGTLANSTAIPLAVNTRGVQAFRVDSVNPQIVSNVGSAVAPTYSFVGSQGTGIFTSATDSLNFATGGVNRVTIDSGGLIGVNTTPTPGYAMTLNGSISMTNGTSVTTSSTELVLSQTGDTYGITRLRLQNRNGSNGVLFENPTLDLIDFGFKPAVGPQANLRLEHRSAETLNSGNSSGELQYIDDSTNSGGPASIVFGIGKNATILNVGNLGINTKNPQQKLDVNGSVAIRNTAIIGATANSGSAAGLQVTGSSQHIPMAVAPVGVAGDMYYNSDTNKLQYHNGTSWGDISSGTGGAGSSLLNSLTAATANNSINNGAYVQTWNWQLATNTTAFAISENTASTGGTGTQYLHTIGTLAGSTAIPLAVNTRGVEAFRVDATNPQILGNLGTLANPTYSFIGRPANGFYMDADGFLVGVVGNQFRGISRSLLLTEYQTGFGFGALSSDPGGTSQNVGIGSFTLGFTSTGNNNVAVGYKAGYHINSNNNTAVGSLALSANVPGANNTVLGAYAMTSSTGAANTAIGYYSLPFSSGSSNVGLGLFSLYQLSSGGSNIGIGNSAGQYGGSGSRNVAVGESALWSFSSGTNNTALGYQSGKSSRSMTSANSTFLGSNSTFADTIPMAASGYITLVGADSSASGLGAAVASSYMTAVGGGAIVTTINSVVLGRASTYTGGVPSGDKTIIGATGDNGSAAVLQVTGAMQLTQMATLPTPTLGMIAMNGNQLQYYNGSSWVAVVAGGSGTPTTAPSVGRSFMLMGA